MSHFPKQLVNLTSHNLANIQLEIPLVSDPQNGSIGMVNTPVFILIIGAQTTEPFIVHYSKSIDFLSTRGYSIHKHAPNLAHSG